MGSSFEFATAARVVFGAGTVLEAPRALAALGVRRVLLVTGKNATRASRLSEELSRASVSSVPFAVPGEPTLDVARAGVALATGENCDAVIALGGGSPLDAGKAIAALVANGGDPLDYVEVIGRGRALEKPSLPFVAIPSTAGTGSEVTKNAVLSDPATKVKVSLRSLLALPRLAVVDPDLLVGAPPSVVASSGVDALSQNVEPLLSCKANPLTDQLAREGIRRSARSLRRAFEGALDTDADVREDLALASLFGGACLANAGLGAVHGFAAPAGGTFGAPHGATCAALLVASLDVNLRALRARGSSHPALDRMREIATLVTGRGHATADDLISWARDLCRALRITGLARHGMTRADVPVLVAKAKVASSMKGNPIPLTDDELTEIAVRSMEDA